MTAPDATVIKKSASGALNSIPLNLDAFHASLDEEQQILLKLELETMGKSWQVLLLQVRVGFDDLSRLKVLLDEIKKPYFLSPQTLVAFRGLERWI